jgi:hypothetical protein
MPPVVRISDSTFAKMQLLAEPLVDTPDQVISRCLDAALEARGLAVEAPAAPSVDQMRHLDPDSPGDLRHTTVKSVSIDGQDVRPANWNAMLREMHSRAMARLESFDELSRASASHLRPGRYEDEGFHYVPEGDFSIQGQDSNLSWSNSLRLARLISTPLAVTFTWQHRDGSAHPGDTGILEWAPSTQ